jgi:toxin-antitoxin system PIN domain toxin
VSRVALLDVNVLVALFDPDHVHHEPAHRWFGKHRTQGWATCPITENEVVRILSTPAYADPPETPANVIVRLQQFCVSGNHEFWSADFTIRDLRSVEGHALANKQITDVYLLALARHRNGRLATFDRSIPLDGVDGATSRNLEIIPA